MAEECVSGRCTKEGRPCPVCGGEVPPSLGFKPRKYCSTKCLRIGSKGIHERLAAKHFCFGCGCEVDYPGRGPHGNILCESCKSAPRKQCHCKRCGSSFSSVKSRDFCNKRCRYPRQLGDLSQCSLCGADFRLSRHDQKLCSSACRDEAARIARAKTAERNRARAKKYRCQNCGDEFVAKNRSRCAFKFCSRECAFEARRLKKQCAKRPAYAYRSMTSWFLSWGDDQWPATAKCDCGKSFVAQRSRSSDRKESCHACCEQKAKARSVECAGCGVAMPAGRRYCDACSSARRATNRQRHRRNSRMKHGNACSFRQRCRKYGCPYTKVSKQDVMQRDGWKCKLCGHRLLDKFTTVMGTRTPHPRCPTIDHIVPLSFGPSSPGHVFDNCQAACWQCNCERGTEDADSFAARKATAVH